MMRYVPAILVTLAGAQFALGAWKLHTWAFAIPALMAFVLAAAMARDARR